MSGLCVAWKPLIAPQAWENGLALQANRGAAILKAVPYFGKMGPFYEEADHQRGGHE